MTWKDLFLGLAPDMASAPIDEGMYFFHRRLGAVAGKIRVRFEAWKLIEVQQKLGNNYWYLTKHGNEIMRNSF